MSHKPGGRLPLLSARPAVTPATIKRAATNFAAWGTEALDNFKQLRRTLNYCLCGKSGRKKRDNEGTKNGTDVLFVSAVAQIDCTLHASFERLTGDQGHQLSSGTAR